MHGLHYKNAVDRSGDKLAAGTPRRATWVAVEAVAHAIGVLERNAE
ncbi:hypothetical protein [Streptomyces sp. NPDC058092]